MAYDFSDEALHNARVAFGSMLKAWRIQNGWTQYTVWDWSLAAGFKAISYGNLSVLENGKAGQLRIEAFIMLHELNRRLVERDFGNITDIQLRDRVRNGKPLCADSPVKPFEIDDFWRCYVGIIPVPIQYQVKFVHFGKQEVARLNKEWRRAFKALTDKHGVASVMRLGISPGDEAITSVQLDRILSFFVGGRDFTPEELVSMCDAGGKPLPAIWLSRLSHNLSRSFTR